VVPFFAPQPPVNFAFWPDGAAASLTATLVAVPSCVDTVTKYCAAWPRGMLVSIRCTVTHKVPALEDMYASSDDDCVDSADGDVADEEECELAVGLGELAVGASVGFSDAVGVGVADVDFDGLGEGEGLLLGGGEDGGGDDGGGEVGGGEVGGGLLDGSALHCWAVPAAKAAASPGSVVAACADSVIANAAPERPAVTSMPPVTMLAATGRTCAKHMRTPCQCCRSGYKPAVQCELSCLAL
jgi:hypothetical protein